ncbi:MAG: DUF1858 domain-containing protein [Clostridiales bacterium]|nr:DUF1858 domain-containing protein [Clostridiales bacterium]
MTVTKDTIIGDLVMADQNIAPLLMSMGLHCLGCVMATGETIEEACMVHGIDADEFVNEVNNFFKENPVPKEPEAEF